MVTRLVTSVGSANAPTPRQLSFSARLDALLADGRRIVLLDDRGWSQSRISFSPEGEASALQDRASPWEGVTRESIEESARTVVGPDAAYGNCTQAEMDEAHWTHLAAVLRRHGVELDARHLEALPHDVQLSDEVLARLADSAA